MSDNEIKITFDRIFDILMNEKNREDIQSLESDFVEEINAYLNEKRNFIEKQKNSEFAETSQINSEEVQIKNIEKMLKQIFEIRISKIINLSLTKMKTGSNLINKENLLEREKQLFELLSNNLSSFYDKVFVDLTNKSNFSEKSTIVENKKETISEKKDAEENVNSETIEKSEEIDEKNDFKNQPKDLKSETDTSLNTEENKEENKEDSDDENILLKFTDFVPKFVGQDLQIYGPYEPNEMASLPSKVAQIIIDKNKARKIEE